MKDERKEKNRPPYWVILPFSLILSSSQILVSPQILPSLGSSPPLGPSFIPPYSPTELNTGFFKELQISEPDPPSS
jgi:hypothetical protein